MTRLNISYSGTAMRMTALAIALVFCMGMFAPMAATAGTVQPKQPATAQSPAPPVTAAAPLPEEPNTVTLQPNATVAKDTNIGTQYPERPYGEWQTMLAGNGSDNYRPLLEFDVPGETAALKSATLSLYSYMTTGDPVNLTVHPVTSPWWEGIGADDPISGASNWTSRMGGSYIQQDFESDDGGLVGTNDWEWGTFGPWAGFDDPTAPVPPPAPHSGTRMWGTVLNSNYNNLNDASSLYFTVDLTSTPISNPVLTFWDWYDVFEQFDHGEVYVNGALALDRQITPPDNYIVPTVWTQQTLSLTPYVGTVVQIEFRLWQSSVVSKAGWYIDDLAIVSASSVPWNTPGGDYDDAVGSYQVFDASNAWCNWDVTEIVRNWMDGTMANNGFIIVSDNPNIAQFNLVWFRSSDYADARYHPKLTLTYSAEITDTVPPQTFQEDGPARTISLSGMGGGSAEHQFGTSLTGNIIPFYGSLYDQMHVQQLYTPSQVGYEGILSRLAFNRTSLSETGSFDNFRISMAHTDLDALTVTYNNNYNGFLTEVFPTQTIFANSSDSDSWIYFNLNGNFTYDSSHNLLIDITWDGDSGSDIALQREVVLASRVWDTGGAATGALADRLPLARFTVDLQKVGVFDSGTDGNYWPFVPGDELSMRAQMLYNHTYINSTGYIDKLQLQAGDLIMSDDWAVVENLTIRLAHTGLSDLTDTFDNNPGGAWTTVLTSPSYNFTCPTNPGWAEIDIDNTFMYNGVDNLLIDITWNGGHYSGLSGLGGVILAVDTAAPYDCRLTSNDYTSATGNIDMNMYNIRVVFGDSPHLVWSATSSDTSLFTAMVTPGTSNLVITPQPNAFGTGTVNIRLTNTEDGNYATQEVAVTVDAVNDAPVLATLPDLFCTEDMPLRIDIASSMSDIDNEIYSLVVSEDSDYATVSGTNITFLYPEGAVSEMVSVTITDPSGLSDTKSFMVNVTLVNDEPYFTGFTANITCDATVLKTINLVSGDEESAANDLAVYTDSEYANVTGHTIQLMYPKGIGTDQITVFLVDELTYGTQNNVSYTLNVTIIDHPEVIAHTPAGTAVPVTTTVQATFDMPMNTTKVENAFSMMLGTAHINGTFAWNANGTVMTFTPDTHLTNGVYDVEIASSAETQDGIKMLSAFRWNFTAALGDFDGDGDGMPDQWEMDNGLDPNVNDADGDLDNDGMPNIYEYENDLDPGVNDADGDADGDGATNLEEYEEGTDPNDPESTPSDFGWIIIVLLVAVIAVVILVVVLLMRRGKKPALETQEGDYPPPPPAEYQQPGQEPQWEQPPPEPVPENQYQE